MLKYSTEQLDGIFHALSDSTRREMVERLCKGKVSVSDLAQPFDMSLPAIVQHLRVLEECGIVKTEKVGRVRTCSLDVSGFTMVEGWVADQRITWEARLDRLAIFLEKQSNSQNNPPKGQVSG
mgnify:CR=1 FL=1